MQDKAKKKKNSVLRKIIIVAFLPIFITIWMAGWILTLIGDPGKPTEIKHKTSYDILKSQMVLKESEEQEDERHTKQPQVVVA